jgi:hypothetical protein
MNSDNALAFNPAGDHQARVRVAGVVDRQRLQLPLDQVVAQRGRDRHASTRVPALELDLALDRVPAPADVDDAGGEVHVIPAQREQLAAPQPGIDRRRPQHAVARSDHLE